MPQTHQNDARTLELAKVTGTEEDIALLQQHVKEVIEGAAFKGSHRSGQFLQLVDVATPKIWATDMIIADAFCYRPVGVILTKKYCYCVPYN